MIIIIRTLPKEKKKKKGPKEKKRKKEERPKKRKAQKKGKAKKRPKKGGNATISFSTLVLQSSTLFLM